ncbi:hypothetical protein [Aliterella atlantica]|uniref:hypothetical protein n=1 Tax=Aliterella atlantica TaxID=1827278 RepID=UPI000AD04646|nr:hypothetical protein [Aliterella atlantica]
MRNRKTIQILAIVISITIAVWVLRGFGILGFIPGGVIWLLVLMAIATAIFGIWQNRWSRF